MESSFKPISIPINTENAQPDTGSANVSAPYSFVRHDEESSSSFFQKVLIAVTVIMVLVAGGFFIWGFLLKSGIEGKRAQIEELQTKIQQFSSGDVKNITTKFHTAKILAKEYPFVTDIFSVLEHSVQDGVVYNKFDTHTDAVSGNYFIDISGVAPNYHTLIQQVDILKTDTTFAKYFVDVEVVSFKPNSKGSIDFSFKIKSNINGVDPENLNNDLLKSRAENNLNTNMMQLDQNNEVSTSIATSTEQILKTVPVVPVLKTQINKKSSAPR